MNFESSHSFEQRFDGLAVYCSDGRFSAACDDFLRNSLKLANCDRMVLPGGAGALVGHDKAAIGHEGVLDDLVFLAEAHDIKRIVLIAHAGCAFYSERLGVREGLADHQQRDLRQVRAMIQDRLPAVEVEGYLAQTTDGGRIQFEGDVLG